MKVKNFKPLWVVLIVVCSLLLLAVIVGVLNATVGKGQWRIGWQSYDYDGEESYTIGSGTVYTNRIKGLELEWMEGEVELLLSEDDAYVSVSEQSLSGGELTDKNCLRWRVTEEGELQIRWRKSGSYLASSAPDKKLTVRIPADMMAEIAEIEVETVSASVKTEGVSVSLLSVETVSGDVLLSGCTVSNLELESVSGDVRLLLPPEPSFTLELESVSGKLLSDFPLTANGKQYLCGSGDAKWSIGTVSGDVTLARQ